MYITRHIITAAAITLTAMTATAQDARNASLERNGAFMTADMDIDLSTLSVESKRAVLLTPVLRNGADSLELPAVGIYGRDRYYHYVRGGVSMLSGADETSVKASKMPQSMPYHALTDYRPWMDGASLTLRRDDYGCCETLLSTASSADVAHYEVFIPQPVYVKPAAEAVKSRDMEGRAFIDFPVNKTDIRADYRGNQQELAKIEATINAVRDDSDVTITAVTLKGYASPEGSYAHNTGLAAGRTEALKAHIQRMYNFGEGIVATDSEPEDWQGLRQAVESSNIDNRQAVLDIIDSNLKPDDKEARIKSLYPADYKFMLQTIYPALRHTDYRIDYTVRGFTDVEEIRRMVRTQPQKLSLEEMYTLAQHCEEGSEEFNELFETAVRMYPDDETANLNAAVNAIRRGDNEAAQRHLKKAGTSPQAVYARGLAALGNGDKGLAHKLMEEARDGGVKQAEDVLRHLK